jgi:predicted nuclease of predicted toxin-antitoxin system
VVVTFDSDFHALLKIGGYRTPSVIRVRVEGLKAEGLSELLDQVLATVSDDIERGALVTVSTRTIRVHRLW